MGRGTLPASNLQRCWILMGPSAFQKHAFQNQKVSLKPSDEATHLCISWHRQNRQKPKSSRWKMMSKMTSVLWWWTSAGFFWLLNDTVSSSLNMKRAMETQHRGSINPWSMTALQQEVDQSETQSWSNLYSQADRVTGTQVYSHLPGLLSSSQVIYRNYEVGKILTDGQRAIRDRKMEIISGWQDISSGVTRLI